MSGDVSNVWVAGRGREGIEAEVAEEVRERLLVVGDGGVASHFSATWSSLPKLAVDAGTEGALVPAAILRLTSCT